MLNVELKILKTPRDFRRFGGSLDDVIRKISESDYGNYKIKEELRELFVTIEGMIFLQKSLNKGVRVLGSFNTRIVEIFDYRKRQKEVDHTWNDFVL